MRQYERAGFTARDIQSGELARSSYAFAHNSQTPQSLRSYAQSLFNAANVFWADTNLIALYQDPPIAEQRHDYGRVVNSYWALYDAISRYNHAPTSSAPTTIKTTTTTTISCNTWFNFHVASPGNISAVIQGSKLKITWSAVADSHLGGYAVMIFNAYQYQANQKNPETWHGAADQSYTLPRTATSYTSKTLPAGFYYVEVDSASPGGNCLEGGASVPGPFHII
jgi:hypothetical protein